MKTLLLTPYITNTRHHSFLRNQTGFGYMVNDIAKHISRINNLDIMVVMCFTPEMMIDGFKVIYRSWFTFFSCLSLKCFNEGLSFILTNKISLKDILRTLYIFLSMGQLERIVRDYDIVHIHGCSALTEAAINVCQRKNVPFLVTLHGLNSFSDKVNLHPSMKHYERVFLKECALKHYPVSFISTGNMKMAVESTGLNADSFYVVCNGCDVIPQKPNIDIRSIYSIRENDFVFACVANVSKNKNQYQVARAWAILPEQEKQRCKVLFVGNYKNDDDLVKYIQNNTLQNNLILCGLQPKDKVHSFYHASDATILASIDEGFGLSIIEGFVYGKPNVTFSDLPAVQDLYDENAMALAENRTDEALMRAMLKVMNNTFDIETIMNYSQRFSFEKMAMGYDFLYRKIVRKNNYLKKIEEKNTF